MTAGIQVAAGDVADGIGHGHDRQAEREGDTEEPDPDVGKGGAQNRASTTPKDQPECADEFGECLLAHGELPLMTARLCNAAGSCGIG